MLPSTANEDSRLSFWLRVREFAVPASMIETATARRLAGDWAGACAAARVDADLNLRATARTHGQRTTARLRADLRHLAPDLLRWHMPRIAPDGLLRPGLTIALARYDAAARDGTSPLYLVARTVPAWADAGQRISLGLWDGCTGSISGAGERRYPHPHPHPNPRYRLDLHRHLWDARRTDELRVRSGAGSPPAVGPLPEGADLLDVVPDAHRCAVERWADEAELLLRADGLGESAVTVRPGSRHRFLLEPGAPPVLHSSDTVSALPVLPDAATWTPPDLELLRTGALDADRLHPLVAAALVPGHRPDDRTTTHLERAGGARLVECRGETHRIALVDGVLAPLDHDPIELRREELLAELTGTPLACLQAIDRAHRRPDCLDDVQERLRHGDFTGALAMVEGLLGPEARLRDGALRDELETAARRRITYGLFRAGLSDRPPERCGPPRHHTLDQRRPARTH
ncbi:hypothetical protein ACIQAC_32225 [Streptomyces sp. NPDC088387]|uniref:hypothetical protein n=1 Tax=Streptomyces sp. NPDC088387 TaxID=3365859 RepID=UPI003807325E